VEIDEFGVAGDREFMVVRESTKVNLKDLPALARICIHKTGEGHFQLSAAGADDIEHTKLTEGDSGVASFLFDNVEVVDQGERIGQWISGVVGERVNLVSLGQPFKRNLGVPPLEKAHDKSQNSFVDVSPVMIVNQATLEDLNNRISEPVTVHRFRPNVVVQGLAAFDEDRITGISGDQLELDHVCPCERCTIVNTDHETGLISGKEPLNMLSQYRRITDGYDSGILFGDYFNVLKGGTLKVGDVLTVSYQDDQQDDQQESQQGNQLEVKQGGSAS
jgi:uncharacterized protein YcbX